MKLSSISMSVMATLLLASATNVALAAAVVTTKTTTTQDTKAITETATTTQTDQPAPVKHSSRVKTKTVTNVKDEAADVAVPCPKPERLMDGAYLGLQAGYDSWKTKLNGSNSYNTLGTLNNPTMNAPGGVAGVMVGYGRVVSDNLYLGAEFFANKSGANMSYSSATSQGTGSTNSAKFSANWSYGVAVLPGVKLNDTSLLYIRLGWTQVNLKVQETANVGGTQYAVSNSRWQNGFTYGLGMESKVYQNWSLRGDYNYTSYSALNDGFGSKWKPGDGQVMLALLYHFA